MVLERFVAYLAGTPRTVLDDLLANFDAPDAQGPEAYVSQMLVDHPELDPVTLAADAVLAVGAFHNRLFGD